MMREIFPFLTAAGLLLILAFTAILLVRKRMQRGEIVQAVVKKAEINDSDPNGSTLVTLTYCFSWEGRTLEIQQKPQYGILPPSEGERQALRWDAKSRRLRELPTGRSLVMPILLYAFGLSFLVLAGGFAAVFSRWFSVIFPTTILEFLSFIAVVIWLSRRQRRTFQAQLNDGILRPVQATFSCYVRRLDSSNEIYDVPLYLCSWNGRTYRIESGSGRRPYRPGDVITIYRDIRNGHVTEAPGRFRALRKHR